MRSPQALKYLRVVGVVVTLGGLALLAAARLWTPRIATPVSVCHDAADGAVRDFDLLLRCGPKLYSQGNEELIIRHFFQDRRGGVFVDVGAAHYKTNSTTYYLEHHLGWRGVAVDARAEYGPAYREYRPATQFFSFLVTDHGGTTEPFYELGSMFLMSTTSKDWAERFGRDDFVVVQVPTITLNGLLERAKVTGIDFLSMDIETGEPAALGSFDIDRYRPTFVCIEMMDVVKDKIASYFDAHGYERVMSYAPYDAINWYFRPKAPR